MHATFELRNTFKLKMLCNLYIKYPSSSPPHRRDAALLLAPVLQENKTYDYYKFYLCTSSECARVLPDRAHNDDLLKFVLEWLWVIVTVSFLFSSTEKYSENVNTHSTDYPIILLQFRPASRPAASVHWTFAMILHQPLQNTIGTYEKQDSTAQPLIIRPRNITTLHAVVTAYEDFFGDYRELWLSLSVMFKVDLMDHSVIAVSQREYHSCCQRHLQPCCVYCFSLCLGLWTHHLRDSHLNWYHDLCSSLASIWCITRIALLDL